MSLKVLTSTLCLTLLAACSTSAPPPSTQAASESPPSDSKKLVEALPPTFIMRGEVVLGHEVRSFTPCNSQQQFWIGMKPEQYKSASDLVREPYQPLYGELIGYLEPSSNTGFSSDYSAQFKVTQINILTAENPNRCTADSTSTRVIGTEPNWNLVFEEDGAKFTRMGDTPQKLTIINKVISDNRREYQFQNGQLILGNNSCSDGMSDSKYGWSATYTIDDKIHKGCAMLSNLDSTQQWVGIYQAASKKNLGFSITVELNSDHTANTRYQYDDGSSTTEENGYWQQSESNKVQVVSTSHQGQRLVAKRTYTLSGDEISTQHETVNGVKYPLADGGLVLFRSN